MTIEINNIESSNYLVCRLNGFRGFELKENKNYEINNDIIKSFQISDGLERITLYLQNDISYNEHRVDIQDFLYKICFNLIVNTEVEYDIPTYSIEVIKTKDSIETKDKITLRDEIKMIVDYPAEYIYEKILQSPTKMKEHTTYYERIFKTLHNPNNIVQFMSLYQFLMDLLKGSKKYTRQKDVTEYIEKNKSKYDFIKFFPTTKADNSFNEDEFTHLRNQIAHCEDTNNLDEYKKLGSQITKQVIKDLIKVINDVIMDI